MSSKSRPEWMRISSCEGKVKYPTNAAASTAKRQIKGGRILKIYRCKFCQNFHLGTDQRRKIG